MINRRGKIGVWYIDAVIDGKRVRRSLGTQDEGEARKLAAEYVAGVRVATGRTTSRATLRQAHRRAMAEHWSGTKGQRTVERNAQLVMGILGPDTLVTRVGLDQITKLVNDLRAAGNKDSSINRKLSWLSKLLRLCQRWGYIDAVPYIPRLKESRGRLRVITPAEERELFARAAAAGYHEELDLWKVLLDTGCRVSELLRLTHRAVDLEAYQITLWDTKNGSFRTVPLTQRALGILSGRRALAGDDPVFFPEHRYPHVGHSAQQKLANRIGLRWNAIREQMNLQADPEFVIHALRHTFASRLVQRGADLYTVQRLLGHSSIRQTEVYAKLHAGNLADAVALLDRHNPSVPDLRSDLKWTCK